MRRHVFGRRRRRRGRIAAAAVVLVAAGGLAATQAVRGAGEAPEATALSTSTATTAPSDAATAPSGEATVLVDEPATAATETAPPETLEPSPVPAPPPLPESAIALGRQLQGIIDGMAESLAGADVAVAVRDELGRSILDVRSDRRMLPASTMKTVTAATVLEVLGPDHRFTTTVAATVPPVDGVIRGDLVLVGGGDPVLASDDYHRYVYPSRPWTSLTELADAVVAAGVTEVTGGLVADASAWGPSTLAAGWPAHYLSDQDARHVSALTVDAGLRVVVGSTPEEPLTVELTPVADPARRAADRLAALLAQRGVVIRGHVTASTFPVPTAARIAAVRSPTVAELLTFTVQRSDNHLADSLLRAAAHGATGDGSWAAANRTAAASLADLGVDPTGLHVADGSGLSRLDRVTAAQLVDLDVTMTAGTAGEPWVASLAVAGETGTLKNRLLGTPGHGRFRGKTGTLDDVKAVVGHVTGPEGRRMHLAVVGNGVPAGGQWAITVLMDTLQLALVDHLDGCWQELDEDGAPRRVCEAAA